VGADTFAFYGAQTGLQTHLTITDFEIGKDQIDVSQLLGANTLSGDALNDYLLGLITNADIINDVLQIDLSGLMSTENQVGASVQLTIQKASITSTGDGESGAMITGDALKVALSEVISSSFVSTSVASDMWLSDLAPLTYPSAT
jgi:hypothetical protein